jgi:hypothetical protein
MGDPLAPFYTQQKEKHGRAAAVLWLLIGVVVFGVDPEARFLSWQAAVYFVAGVIVAAILFGSIGYRLQQLVAKAVMETGAHVATLRTASGALYLANAGLIYVAARWLVGRMF